MVSKTLVVAALLLTILIATAAAADTSEHPSQNAQKLVATLNSMGVNNQDVQNFIEEVNSNIDNNGYLNLAQQEVMGGQLSLRYPVSASDSSSRRLELNYSPEDSHFTATARTDGAMVGWRLKF